jgi:hypothetical protein
MRKTFTTFCVLLLQINFIQAHVGNPNITLEGTAGPYHVLVNIQTPNAIPGTATITVFTATEPGINLYVRPIYFYSGINGAPPPDQIQAVRDHPGQFNGILWLMDEGSSSIELSISGPLGKGELVIPLVAMSSTEKKLPPSTAYMLLAMGLLLFVLMLTIIGSSVFEAITKQGEPITVKGRYARRIAFGVFVVLSCLIVYGGNVWWQAAANNYRKYLFKPMHATYSLKQKKGFNELQVKVDPAQSKRGQWLFYVIPDHGKIMHLFIISIPGMDILAHLHPVRVDSLNFATPMPPLPKGRYLGYADIVYNSGFTETIKDTFSITDNLLENSNVADTADDTTDDAFAFAIPFNVTDNPLRENKNSIICGQPGVGVKMKDGTIMIMEQQKNNEDYISGNLYSLHFSLWDNNKPVTPDLYMGMRGHAIIVRKDGNVFSHIHPVGTYSMAAQESLINRMNQPENEYSYPDKNHFKDSIDQLIKTLAKMSEEERNDYLLKEMKMTEKIISSENIDSSSAQYADDNLMIGMNKGNSIHFPYSFPSPGMYRIWVQVKRNGKVLTAVFDRKVQ